ncbi:hypothetical protein K1T71_002182 [Dendrolimus kikuchii]|uniref:Uncharacterized protein n=1 Tax=Dendrolimus kikuchii TaxID=765133 RepID=A0ACC1DFT4_9NEOP|nr:hypothetical protein K1T71_002182 [Dendrolimus kikuchii]
MPILKEKIGNGLNPSEPAHSKLFLPIDDSGRDSVCGSVMDGMAIDSNVRQYKVYTRRWFVLAMFVIYSASNSAQWTQYTIISDIVVDYYGVDSTVVSWTSMVYMITYVPLIFPASWLLDKTSENEEQSHAGIRARCPPQCQDSKTGANIDNNIETIFTSLKVVLEFNVPLVL